jgi:hypothetical protein
MQWAKCCEYYYASQLLILIQQLRRSKPPWKTARGTVPFVTSFLSSLQSPDDYRSPGNQTITRQVYNYVNEKATNSNEEWMNIDMLEEHARSECDECDELRVTSAESTQLLIICEKKFVSTHSKSPYIREKEKLPLFSSAFSWTVQVGVSRSFCDSSC